MTNLIICPCCSMEYSADEYNSEADECLECHAGYEEPMECRCEQCNNRLVAIADRIYDHWRDG